MGVPIPPHVTHTTLKTLTFDKNMKNITYTDSPPAVFLLHGRRRLLKRTTRINDSKTRMQMAAIRAFFQPAIFTAG